MTKCDFAWCAAIFILVGGPALGQSAIAETLPKEAKRLDSDAIRSLMGTGATSPRYIASSVRLPLAVRRVAS